MRKMGTISTRIILSLITLVAGCSYPPIETIPQTPPKLELVAGEQSKYKDKKGATYEITQTSHDQFEVNFYRASGKFYKNMFLTKRQLPCYLTLPGQDFSIPVNQKDKDTTTPDIETGIPVAGQAYAESRNPLALLSEQFK